SEGASLKLKTPTTMEQFIRRTARFGAVRTTSAPRPRFGPAVARACRKLAGQLGELSAFDYRGQSLDDAAIAECNTAAKPQG
ncbi:hypothetical protein, partial [Caulobacter sp. BP25]|uniref:CC_3452 family protein n=1 Tax=Caulobacter sp. BP25 TaxID=2048900 RepID=UPI001F4026A3